MSLSRRKRLLARPELLPAATFAVMLIVSWRKWTGMIVDIGRETDLPRRLLEGELLYRDIHYLYPPFSPYFNALIYGVFGVSLDTLAFAGIFFTALLSVLAYFVARRLVPPLEASLAVSLIILLCFFKPAGNSILPYSFATVHAAVFNLSALLFLLRHSESANRLDLVAAGIFTGMAVITKQEFGFAIALTAAVYLAYIHRADLKAFSRDLAHVACPAVVIAAPVYGWFLYIVGWRTLVYDCHLFYTNIPESLVKFNSWRSGLDHPFASFLQMIGGAAVASVAVSMLVAVSDRTGRIAKKALAVAIVSAAVAGTLLFIYIDDWDGSPIRAMPFLLAAMIVYLWRRGKISDRKTRSFSGPALFIVAVYSLAILLRSVLRVPSGGFSGGSYLITSLMIVYLGLLVSIPAWVEKKARDEASARRARRLALLICVLPVVGLAVAFGIRYEKRYVHRIEAPKGTLYVDKSTGPVLEKAIEYIGNETRPGEYIAVIPEGNDLAFLTGRRIDLRHQVLIPDFMDREDELEAIEAMKLDDVRYVFLLNRPMREFGAVAFGEDFYTTLGGWINENFEVVEIFGAEDAERASIGDPEFFIKVYKRKDAAGAGSTRVPVP